MRKKQKHAKIEEEEKEGKRKKEENRSGSIRQI